jgi:SSS family solute:Na+ symporter
MAVFNINACKTYSLSEKALAELKTTLKTQPEFIKVHAAEYLIWLGQTEEVRKEFLHENELHGNEPKYRIGIWRVLAQTETDAEKKKIWYNKVFQAFGDLNGPDRLHAAETLAKLKLSPLEKYPEATQKSMADELRNMQVYTHWALSYAPNADTNKFRQDFLQMAEGDSNQVVRIISAYIVRRINHLIPDEWTKLSQQALAEPDSSELKKILLNTAVVTFPEGIKKTADYDKIRQAITHDYQHFSVGERIGLAQALAEVGNESDIQLLSSYLDNENSAGIYDANTKEGADVRAAAAYAILKIKERTNK